MGFINHDPSLQVIFNGIYKRLLKLETAIRFSAPFIKTDPTAPVKGDIWLNSTSNEMKYLDGTGTPIVFGTGGGGGGGTRETFTSVTIGTQAGLSSTWLDFELVSVAARGLVTSFTITPSVLGVYYNTEVRSAASGGGDIYLSADGIANAYSITSPWYYETPSGSSMWIRIKNYGAVSATFTLTFMRIEKWA